MEEYPSRRQISVVQCHPFPHTRRTDKAHKFDARICHIPTLHTHRHDAYTERYPRHNANSSLETFPQTFQKLIRTFATWQVWGMSKSGTFPKLLKTMDGAMFRSRLKCTSTTLTGTKTRLKQKRSVPTWFISPTFTNFISVFQDK